MFVHNVLACALFVRVFTDSAVIQEAGEASPQLMKQRSHTESHAAAPEGEPIQSSETPISSNSRDSSKFNTPIQGRPRPVPPKKIITGTGCKTKAVG